MSIKQKAVSTKNFVKKHRVAIAVIATSTVWLALNHRALEEIQNDFLKEHDLYDEFYTPEEEV